MANQSWTLLHKINIFHVLETESMISFGDLRSILFKHDLIAF